MNKTKGLFTDPGPPIVLLHPGPSTNQDSATLILSIIHGTDICGSSELGCWDGGSSTNNNDADNNHRRVITKHLVAESARRLLPRPLESLEVAQTIVSRRPVTVSHRPMAILCRRRWLTVTVLDRYCRPCATSLYFERRANLGQEVLL